MSALQNVGVLGYSILLVCVNELVNRNATKDDASLSRAVKYRGGGRNCFLLRKCCRYLFHCSRGESLGSHALERSSS